MAEFLVKQKKVKGGLQLKVSGSLIIEHAGEMRELLLAAFAKADQVTVDLTDLEQVDLSGLQLICAACRTAMAQEKLLVVLGSTQEKVNKSAQVAGYYRHVGCSQDVTKTCVWVGGV